MQGALKNAGSFLSRVSSQVTGAENGNLSKKAKERLEEALKKGDIDVVQEVLGDGSEVKVNKIRFGFTGGQSVLHKRTSHLDIVDLLLTKYGAKPDAKNDTGKTPVHSAANKGYTEIVRILIEKGEANVNARDNYGNTPVRLALPHEETLNFLLVEAGADANIADNEKRTPLHEAVATQNRRAVWMLLVKGKADPDRKDWEGNTPLALAVRKEDHDIAELLLKEGKADPNAQVKKGKTVMDVAVSKKSVALVELLLEHGSFENTDLSSALHEAIVNEDIAIAELLLLKSVSNVDGKNQDGKTPLHSAIEKGLHRIVSLLVNEKGADLNIQDNTGRTPLHYSVSNDSKDLMQLLFNKEGTNPNIQDNAGRTPLLDAVSKQCPDIDVVIILLRQKADKECKEFQSFLTPLLQAVTSLATAPTEESTMTLDRKKRVLGILVEAGADSNAIDKWGRNALHLSVTHPEIIQYLLKNTIADYNAKNADGQTPLQLAEQLEIQRSHDLLQPENINQIYRAQKLKDAETIKKLRQELARLSSSSS